MSQFLEPDRVSSFLVQAGQVSIETTPTNPEPSSSTGEYLESPLWLPRQGGHHWEEASIPGSSSVPSLSYGTATPSSYSTLSLPGVTPRYALSQGPLEADLSIPGTRNWLECAFWFLPCWERFEDPTTWKTHCLSHFHGIEPPRRVMCPLCNQLDNLQYADGWTAWEARMSHVQKHYEQGETMARSRPDPDLIKYLWRYRIIDTRTYHDLITDWYRQPNKKYNTYITANRPREDHRSSQTRPLRHHPLP